MTITRQDLVRQVSSEHGFSPRATEQVINALFDRLLTHLMAGDRVEVRGLGSFTVKPTNARPQARNPRTGERVRVPPRRKVHFKPGRLIQAALRTQRGT